MSSDKVFKRWMQGLTVLFITLFAYIVIADRQAPLTTEGRVQGYVVQIAPEVSGKVIEVMVANNQRVEKDQPLFRIDDRKFQIALNKAKHSLQSALEKEATLYSQRKAAIANIARAKAQRIHAEREYARLSALSKQKLTSQSNLDSAEAELDVAKASLAAQQQNLKVIEAQLGAHPGESAAVELAKNEIDKAQLDLSNTLITAPTDGVITNLQLQAGSIAMTNSPMLSFIPSRSLWVAADFREKSVAKVDGSYQALIAFDALPGEVFPFELSSRDYGVAAAQQLPNGSLTKVEGNNRWVRDAQRTRVNLSATEALPSPLFVGSRATIVLYPEEGQFWQAMAKMQIQLASWFHFIY